MRIVVQRVKKASVTVDNKKIGQINNGLLLLLGVHANDTEDQLKWLGNKILNLRIFEDEDGKMNKSIKNVNGELLVVSQFTLYGNLKKGTRPSFIEAARPEKAEPMYEQLIDYFKTNSDLKVQTGEFGADMDVELINDGPVTIILEK